MGFRYAVLGAGRQGTAAAYDFAVRGDANSVLLADMDIARAKDAAKRVNRLSGTSLATAAKVDVTRRESVLRVLRGIDVFLSAVLLTGFVVTWYAGLKEVDLSVATSVLVLATPITTVLAAVFDGRTYSAVYAAGLTAIVLGVVAVLGLASLRDMWTHLSRQVRLRAWGARHP